MEKAEKDETDAEIQKAFNGKQDITGDDFEAICVKVCKIPKILKKCLFERIKLVANIDAKAEKLPKQSFINFWKTEYEMESVSKRVFKLLA